MIFKAAASALGSLIRAGYTAVNRCEIDQMMSVVKLWRAAGPPTSAPRSAVAGRRGRTLPQRRFCGATSRPEVRPRPSVATSGWRRARSIGLVACPVIVDDLLWGAMSALYLGSEPPPDDTEERMGKFLELLNCAITQAETRAELIASRARPVDRPSPDPPLASTRRCPATETVYRKQVRPVLVEGDGAMGLIFQGRAAADGLPPGDVPEWANTHEGVSMWTPLHAQSLS